MKIRLLGLAFTVLLGGCGSIADMLSDRQIYGGVQKGVHLIQNPYLPKTSPPEYFFPLVLIGIIDVPLSAVLDTVFLPITVTLALIGSDEEPPYR